METFKKALPFAEDIPYFQTSQSDTDTWLDRTKKMIREAGGKVTHEAFASENGVSCFVLVFVIGIDIFKILWPVLPSRSGKTKAAKVQAVTLMYHDVKARCVTAAVFGLRTAFLPFLVLPDGSTAAQVSTPNLAIALPAWVQTSTGTVKQMTAGEKLNKGDAVYSNDGISAHKAKDGDVIEGEFK
jgi:hypothetical protein